LARITAFPEIGGSFAGTLEGIACGGVHMVLFTLSLKPEIVTASDCKTLE